MDRESREFDTRRIARIPKDIFNDIEQHLKLTVGIEEVFEDQMLPTLDNKLKMTENILNNQLLFGGK